MIVVNHAAERIGATAEIVVGGTLQTSAGRLIFAELAENAENPSGQRPTSDDDGLNPERPTRGPGAKLRKRLPESAESA